MRSFRVDLRLAAAAVLALVAGLGVLALTRPPDRVTILLADESLPAGAVLGQSALRETEVEPLAGLLLAAELDGVASWTIDVPTAAGSPITHAMLSPPPGTTPDLVALTLERRHALQGLLTPGDLVDIYETSPDGTDLIASSIPIVSVEIGAGGLGADEVSMLLAIDEPGLAARLVAAMHTADLDLALVSP